MRIRRPGRLAVLVSAILHALAAVAFWHWLPQIDHVELAQIDANQEVTFEVTWAEPEPERSVAIPPSASSPEPMPADPPQPDVLKPVKVDASAENVVEVVHNLQQAEHREAVSTAPPTAAPASTAPKIMPGKVLHGTLPQDRKAVYLLDRSASMGLVRGTFDAAKGALQATAVRTPAGSSLQVLAYNGDAISLIGARGQWVKSDLPLEANLKRSLNNLDAEGRSDHAAALKAALALQPDYIIWITDADATELESLKRLVKGASKPVAVYLCQAVAGKVESPEVWK